MIASSGYELVLTPPAGRALAERFPEAVAAAVTEFLTTAVACMQSRFRAGNGVSSQSTPAGQARDEPASSTDQAFLPVRISSSETVLVV